MSIPEAFVIIQGDKCLSSPKQKEKVMNYVYLPSLCISTYLFYHLETIVLGYLAVVFKHRLNT